jgi:hypothetical protein
MELMYPEVSPLNIVRQTTEMKTPPTIDGVYIAKLIHFRGVAWICDNIQAMMKARMYPPGPTMIEYLMVLGMT